MARIIDGANGSDGFPISTSKINTQPKRISGQSAFSTLNKPVIFGSKPRPNYKRPSRPATRPSPAPAYGNDRFEIIDTNGPGLPFEKPQRHPVNPRPSPLPPPPPPPPSDPGHGTKIVVISRPKPRPPVFNKNPTRPTITLPPVYNRREDRVRPIDYEEFLKFQRQPNKEDPVEALGISKERPEILAITDYSPIYTNGRKNTHGLFMDLQFDVRSLKLEKLKDLMASLEATPSIAPTLERLKERYIKNITELDNQINFFRQIVGLLKTGEIYFDVRTSLRTTTRSTLLGNQSKSMKDVLIEYFGYKESEIRQFSSTRLIGQYLRDYSFIVSQYTPNLLDKTDVQRPQLTDPAGTYAQSLANNQSDFYFSFEDYRSPLPEVKNFGEYQEFDQLIYKLPFKPEDRIKVLSSMISKEIRISCALSNYSFSNRILKEFGYYSYYESDHPIKSIVGESGTSVTDYVTEENSLMSLTQIITEGDVAVLPFERAIIKGKKGRKFLPGQEYLIDSILENGASLSTENLDNFTSKFKHKIEAQTGMVSEMLNLTDEKRTLFSNALFDKMSQGIAFISMAARFSRKDMQRMVPFALLSLADKDLKLKRQMFQLCTLMGLKGGQNKTNPFFTRLAKKEMRRLHSLSEVGYSRDRANNEFLGNSTEIKESSESSDSGVPNAGRVGIPWGKFLDQVQVTGNSSLRNGVVVDVAIDILVELIARRVLAWLGTGQRVKLDTEHQLLSKSQLITAIKKNLKPLKWISDLMGFIETEAEKLSISRSGIYYDSENYCTVANKLSSSTLFAMVFELASSMFNRSLDANLVASNKRGSIYVKSNVSYNEAIGKFFGELSSSTPKNLQNSDNTFLVKSWSGSKMSTKNLKNFNQYIEFARKAKHDSTLPTPTPWPRSDKREYGRIQELYTAMRNIKAKLIQEDFIILDVAEGLDPLAERLNNYSDLVKKFFNTKVGDNAKKIEKLKVDIEGGKISTMLKRAQMNIAVNDMINLKSSVALTSESSSQKTNSIYYKGKKQTNSKKGAPTNETEYPVFFDDTLIPPKAQQFVDDMLKGKRLTSTYGLDTKIFSVGLPAGFADSLINYADLNTLYAKGGNNLQDDIIKIKVYKKDVNFESIVFRPQEFLFEMDRFISKTAFTDLAAERISEYGLSNTTIGEALTRKVSPRFISAASEDVKTIENNPEYSFLDFYQKRDLIQNHINDYLLQIYLQVFTGISFEEKTFPVETIQGADRFKDETKEIFKRMIEQYSAELLGRPVTIEDMKAASRELSILLNKIERVSNQQSTPGGITVPVLPNADLGSSLELTEDLQSFVKTFKPGSLFTGGDAIKNKILTPKAFDRVFNFFLNPNDFVIDVKKTKETEAGRIELNGLFKEDLLFTRFGRGDFLFKKQRGVKKQVSFDQFFVTIETVGSSI